ncbi:hypothetical protein RSSM_02554 [Rhodopirellula sallentina SM41]|uniref:Uncharacterized protein n=1 Tax=Rhodopirellula sallentina SM41 TaxID=1263870 RepID=M5U3H5_9BACT|nr:hypothetical protein RSSM_02554 [Rhodopirellula sallentina SM41]
MIVSGSSWDFFTSTFVDAIDDDYFGTDGVGELISPVVYGSGNGLGRSLPGTGQTQSVPWSNVDTIYVDFSEDVQKVGGGTIDLSDLSLAGNNVSDYESHASYGLTTSYTNNGGAGPFRLTISLAGSQDFGIDNLALLISGSSVADAAGNALDGDWINNSSEMSGDGTAGGDFVFAINVLPGDHNGNGFVSNGEVSNAVLRAGTFATGSNYNPQYDILGESFVSNGSIQETKASVGTFWPGGTPSTLPASGGGSAMSASRLSSGESSSFSDGDDEEWAANAVDKALELLF